MKHLITFVLCFLLMIPAACAAGASGPEKEHPCIRVTTESEQPILSRDEYVPAVVEVFNCADEYEMSGEAGIRVRGNSTAEQGDKKPYRIRFEKKQNMLGLHHGRKYRNWVLLRTDRHLCKDYLAFMLAKTIFGGKYYSSDCLFVNLYINGEDRGMYLLCEQNQAAKDRMDVHEPEEGDSATDVGYLLEMDHYPDEEHPGFEIPETKAVEDFTGRKRALPERHYAVKSDVWSDGQTRYIRQWLTGAYTVLYEAAVNGQAMRLEDGGKAVPVYGMTPFEAVDELLDLESLADMLILEELVQNYDVGAGSFYMAVDFSKGSRYEKLTFLGPWDFSWGYKEPADGGYYAGTFQNPIDGMDNSNPWFILAMKLDGFREIVKARWRELSSCGLLRETTRTVMENIESLAGDLDGNAARGLAEARDNVDYVNARIRWLDEQWNP